MQASISYTLGAKVENLTLTGSGHQRHRQCARQHHHRQRRQQHPRRRRRRDTLIGGAGTTPRVHRLPATAQHYGSKAVYILPRQRQAQPLSRSLQDQWTVSLVGVEKSSSDSGTGEFLLVGGKGCTPSVQASINAAMAQRHDHATHPAPTTRASFSTTGSRRPRRQSRRHGSRHTRGRIHHRQQVRGRRRQNRSRQHAGSPIAPAFRQHRRHPRQRQQRFHHQLRAPQLRHSHRLRARNEERRRHSRPDHQQQPDRTAGTTACRSL